MSVPSVSLSILPAEIIKRIATFLPCASAISLMRVNRRFHHIVNDRLVFQAIIETRTGFADQALSWTSDLQCILPSNSPSSTWARLALADEKATGLLLPRPPRAHHPDPDTNPPVSPPPPANSWPHVQTWLPHLSLLHHPILSSFPYLASITRTIEEEWGIPESHDLTTFDLPLTLLVLELGMPRLLCEPGPTEAALTALKAHLLRHDTYQEPIASEHKIQAVFMCALVQWLQKEAREGAFDESGEGRKMAPTIWPPSTRNIPFTSFIDIDATVPFPPHHQQQQQQRFQSCHLGPMVTKEFFEEGEWAAYYSLSMNFQSEADPVVFQPPMVDIRFSATVSETQDGDGDGDGDDGRLVLSAKGNDPWGGFTAVGSIGRDGVMEMEETNWRGMHWIWSVRMCPLGLFGIWGTRERQNGFMWVFKREWCHKPEGENAS